ncbi:MAG: hypothetical protein KKD44_25735 [Proteobacteria bacterium]|nr:hypothetical protein [Pseudomonadota bacterium]
MPKKRKLDGNGRCPGSPTEVHWWLIETPQGEYSQGVCRYCLEERTFPNTADAAIVAGYKMGARRGDD